MKHFDFAAFFALGMKRDIGVLPEQLSGRILNLGAGTSIGPWTDTLDLPEWDVVAEDGRLPFEDESFDCVMAFHFLEHLTGDLVIKLLLEVQRVLRRGGVFLTCTPHRLGSMAFQDLDHKSFWTEDSWKTLFSNPYYKKHSARGWELEVRFNLIAGIAERNLALFSVLEKKE